jgi:uncharacterized protein YktA (UPF0223 family)
MIVPTNIYEYVFTNTADIYRLLNQVLYRRSVGLDDTLAPTGASSNYVSLSTILEDFEPASFASEAEINLYNFLHPSIPSVIVGETDSSYCPTATSGDSNPNPNGSDNTTLCPTVVSGSSTPSTSTSNESYIESGGTSNSQSTERLCPKCQKRQEKTGVRDPLPGLNRFEPAFQSFNVDQVIYTSDYVQGDFNPNLNPKPALERLETCEKAVQQIEKNYKTSARIRKILDWRSYMAYKDAVEEFCPSMSSVKASMTLKRQSNLPDPNWNAFKRFVDRGKLVQEFFNLVGIEDERVLFLDYPWSSVFESRSSVKKLAADFLQCSSYNTFKTILEQNSISTASQNA